MALLTVILLVAVMAAVAVIAMDDLRFGLRRSGNASEVAQARWYAIGAESFAGVQLRRIAALDPDRTVLSGGWLGRTQRFPIEGGMIEARLREGGNCFNLNSLRASEETEPEPSGAGGGVQRPLPQRQFRALLIALQISPREAEDVVDAVVDWVDADGQRTGTGWEDDAYGQIGAGYRTGGTLLAEASELRAMAPVSAELYARIRPFVCAPPTEAPSRLNVNTIESEDAVLLTMLSAGALAPAQARQLLASRPAEGWSDAGAFWQTAAGFGLVGSDALRAQTDVKSRYFLLDTRVRYQDADIVASALLEQTAADRVVTRARRWTADE